jgi:DNA-binding CsgD family transcriptional regulator
MTSRTIERYQVKATSNAPDPRRAGDVPGRKGVTPRELEVLELIAEGDSTAEIARALWITEDTVRTHVKRMLVRLDARTRAHAVAIACREGLWRPNSRNGGGELR